jgi:hypothetical protein
MDHTLKDYALALQLLGAEVDVCNYSKLATAKHGKTQVRFWISDKYGLFGVGFCQDGTMPTIYSFSQIREVLGLTGYIRPTTILTRAMKHLGLTNRRATSVQRDFYVHGEYNNAGGGLKERVRTVVDFTSKSAEKTVAEHWDELKSGLDLTGYSFKLHRCADAFSYVSN